jgi:hypothetical protein
MKTLNSAKGFAISMIIMITLCGVVSMNREVPGSGDWLYFFGGFLALMAMVILQED